MVDGLWVVEFISSLGRSGAGIVVLANQRLLGGDFGYYYSGHFSAKGDNLEATATVTRFDRTSVSIFGDLDHFSLTIKGKVRDGEFTAEASVNEAPQMKMTLHGLKKEDI